MKYFSGSFYSTVRVRFPFKESKVVADLGDSVALICSAEGYPLNVTWNKNKPGSTAIIKRKIYCIEGLLGRI